MRNAMLNKHMATLDFNSHDIKEIVICPNCHGFGYKMRDVTVDYNENKRKILPQQNYTLIKGV